MTKIDVKLSEDKLYVKLSIVDESIGVMVTLNSLETEDLADDLEIARGKQSSYREQVARQTRGAVVSVQETVAAIKAKSSSPVTDAVSKALAKPKPKGKGKK